jgi:hypothetical protein
MSEINRKENPIHTSSESTHDMRNNFSFLKTTDEYHQFLLTLYKSVIGQPSYPLVHQPRLIVHLENLVELFDWAWMEFSYKEKYLPHGKVHPGINPSLPSFTDYSIDVADYTLNFSRWIPERRKLYEGNLRILNQMDIYSDHSFFYKLFEHKTLRSWKETLIQWEQYALDPGLSLTDSGICTAYEVYTDYEYLQKLGEIGWIAAKQLYETNFLELHPWFYGDNYPLFITYQESTLPYHELYTFFHVQSLSERKKSIKVWMSSAVNRNKIWKGVASDLVWFYMEIGQLLECCWIIGELGPNYPEEWNRSMEDIGRKDRAPDEEPTELPEEFITKPENYLHVFFKHNPLNNSRHFLFECLYYALGGNDCLFFSTKDIKEFQKKLILLTEAAYLIQKMKFKKH